MRVTVSFVVCALQKSETPGPMKGRGFDFGVHVFVAIVFVVACVAAVVAFASLAAVLLVE